jgi:hypothetical protein
MRRLRLLVDSLFSPHEKLEVFTEGTLFPSPPQARRFAGYLKLGTITTGTYYGHGLG